MFRITVNSKDVLQRLGALSGQMPTVVRNALNDTAWGLRSHMQQLIKTTFPTAHPSTIRNVVVLQAGKQTKYYDRRGVTTAVVLFDQLYRKGMDEYMLPLIEGGGRAMKPSESRMSNYWIPAYKANPGMLNKYGNVPGGKVQQILSRMGLFNEGGYNSNARSPGDRKKKWYGAKKETEYFVMRGRANGLLPGVYQRVVKPGQGLSRLRKRGLGDGAFQQSTPTFGKMVRDPKTGKYTSRQLLLPSGKQGYTAIRARGIKPVMIFTKQPQYRATFPFFTSGNQYINDNLPRNINKEINRVISKHFKGVGL